MNHRESSPLPEHHHFIYENGIQGNHECEQILKAHLTEVTKKIDTIKENHYFKKK